MATYTSQYPPAQSDTYVKSTTKYSTSYWAYYSTDPTKSLIGASSGNCWAATTYTNQRFHIDLGTAKIIRRLYYENYHDSGGLTTAGVKAFVLQGSNSATAFSTLTYATNTDWVDLTTDVSQFDAHVASNTTDPKFVYVDNSIAYRYYAIKIANCYRTDSNMAVRRFELQTEDNYGTGIYPRIVWY